MFKPGLGLLLGYGNTKFSYSPVPYQHKVTLSLPPSSSIKTNEKQTNKQKITECKVNVTWMCI